MLKKKETKDKKEKKETKTPWNKVDKRIIKFFRIWFKFGLFISIITAIAVGISGFMAVISVFIHIGTLWDTYETLLIGSNIYMNIEF